MFYARKLRRGIDFLTVLEAEMFKIKVPAYLVFGADLFLACRKPGRDRER